MKRAMPAPRPAQGRDRAAAVLAGLQLGACPECGRARYSTRRDARHAARVASPGQKLRAFACGGFWHLQTAGHGRELTASPVISAVSEGGWMGGLDLLGRVERSCGGRDYPAGPVVRPGGPAAPVNIRLRGGR